MSAPPPRSLTDFGALLRTCRKARALTQQDLADATGISKSYLCNIETGHVPGPPSPAKLRKIETALQLEPETLAAPADWLRTPESVRQQLRALPRRADGAIDLDVLLARPDRPAPRGKSSARNPGTIHPVPVINRVAAGPAAEHTDLHYPVNIADAYVPAPPPTGDPEAAAAWKSAFAARVTGDSMAPTYREGDLVVVAPLPWRDGEDCLVRLGPEENFATTLKRICRLSDNQRVELVPLNPAHTRRVVNLEQISGIYPVIYKITPVRR